MKTLNVQDSKLKCIFADEQMPAVVPSDSHGHREADAVSDPPGLRHSSLIHFDERMKINDCSLFSFQPSSRTVSTPPIERLRCAVCLCTDRSHCSLSNDVTRLALIPRVRVRLLASKILRL